MTSRTSDYLPPLDVHAALARAHADRGEYLSQALAELPALLKRLVAHLRPHRRHLSQSGSLASRRA